LKGLCPITYRFKFVVAREKEKSKIIEIIRGDIDDMVLKPSAGAILTRSASNIQ
jgi:hypothetical protein